MDHPVYDTGLTKEQFSLVLLILRVPGTNGTHSNNAPVYVAVKCPHLMDKRENQNLELNLTQSLLVYLCLTKSTIPSTLQTTTAQITQDS